ncbi:hypothetical protein X975_22163, partial [Stegodyphus mimosarum]
IYSRFLLIVYFVETGCEVKTLLILSRKTDASFLFSSRFRCNPSLANKLAPK